MAANTFKSWMADKRPTPPVGTWLMTAAPATAEAMGFCGFDFLVVDMEHVPIDPPQAVDILRAIAGTGAEPVVRLPWNDQVMVKRMLDAGAATLMFPFVQSAEEAARAVAFTRYPPAGVRGVAAIHRASRYGQAPDYLATAADGLAVIVQVETPEAVDRIAEIAAVPGVDALFLGPGDLSAAMGRLGQASHPEVMAVIAQAAEDCHAAGKPIGIVGPNPEVVGQYVDFGYDFVAVASDMAMMTGRAGEWLSTLTGRRAAAGAGPY